MFKNCLTCQATKPNPLLNKWIEEKQYLGGLKTEADYQKNYQGSVYYCSWTCLEKQFDKREKADWTRGNCSQCQRPLVVVNDTCFNQKHQQEAHYLAIDYLKKGVNHD